MTTDEDIEQRLAELVREEVTRQMQVGNQYVNTDLLYKILRDDGWVHVSELNGMVDDVALIIHKANSQIIKSCYRNKEINFSQYDTAKEILAAIKERVK